tara:strand:- start:852 stop:2255 length:1404 start_codon:yes stop_codon:yes gene_type:complete
MPFTNVPLQLAGPTDQLNAKFLDNQLTKNMYLYFSDAGISLRGFPGLTLFSTGTKGVDRGSHIYKGELYSVNGKVLEKIDSSGTRTTMGAISGTARCIFASDVTDMFIVFAGEVSRLTGTTLTTGGGSGFESPDSVAYINDQFVYDGNNNRVGISDVGDGYKIISDNYTNANATGGHLHRVWTFNDIIYLMKEKAIEPWYNSGVGSPPIDRVETAHISQGVQAIHSVAHTTQFTYFLDSENNFRQLRGGKTENISTAYTGELLSEMTDTSDAVGLCFNLQGQPFYYVTFPTGDTSLLYSEAAKKWTTLSYGVNDARHLISSFQRVYDKNLVTDHRNGNIYELDFDSQTDNTDMIQRQRILPTLSSAMLKSPNKRILLSKIYIDMEKGVGILTGQGSDPVILVETSVDGGYSWLPAEAVSTGEMGEKVLKVIAYQMASGYEITIRLTVTDPVVTVLKGVSVDLKLYGN